MTPASLESYSWPHRDASLPTERDFDPYGGDLDCQHALKIFGGMPLDQAYQHTSRVIVDNMMMRDAEEGIGAFLEKRKPEWNDE